MLKTLTHWIADPDLASLRDEPEMGAVPEAEREECRALWAAVAALRRRAEHEGTDE